ncbi:transposase [bacterium]|nr:transposase [bacterium]
MTTFHFFLKDTLIIRPYRRCSFNTIRTKFIKLAGQISSEDEMTLIELSQRYRYKKALRYMLNRLNKLLLPWSLFNIRTNGYSGFS